MISILLAVLKELVTSAPDIYNTVEGLVNKHAPAADAEHILQHIKPARFGAVDDEVDQRIKDLDLPRKT